MEAKAPIILGVDTRESMKTKAQFKHMSETRGDIEVIFKKLDTGDFITEQILVENKEINDFISSFTQRITRKDGTIYRRLDSQVQRLLEAPQPVKKIVIHGDWKDVYSNIKMNAVIGQIASIEGKGLPVTWLPSDIDWVYYIYRLAVKAEKYCKKGE